MSLPRPDVSQTALIASYQDGEVLAYSTPCPRDPCVTKVFVVDVDSGYLVMPITWLPPSLSVRVWLASKLGPEDKS
jgi:hypothetical protein